jgi:hypothetical protein
MENILHFDLNGECILIFENDSDCDVADWILSNSEEVNWIYDDIENDPNYDLSKLNIIPAGFLSSYYFILDLIKDDEDDIENLAEKLGYNWELKFYELIDTYIFASGNLARRDAE